MDRLEYEKNNITWCIAKLNKLCDYAYIQRCTHAAGNPLEKPHYQIVINGYAIESYHGFDELAGRISDFVNIFEAGHRVARGMDCL
ncbi:hypothetical protein SELR_pSRC300590 (plasmid) [Selenomonas ruminantium subsp. lactilytica TAM6421]|uniref:Uncharacterized protein n=1 Tax=Selenomonas ruminantium subsp. lactilytica (strain NBRC 103574 / TAM6421) TaxID=927704 RepID=I0GWJ5_SELRL|nr:hypothetical protein [Selenomonas ruminantium]BAL85132.1 hypothetical protein SELR_pSRC300590 [Selenomonas ruminantium subsp. lactilytica TAM6421]